LLQALKALYPEHAWDTTKFRAHGVPRGYWKDVQNQRQFMDRLGAKLGIQKSTDWYKVSYEDILKNGGAGVLSNNKSSLLNCTQDFYTTTYISLVLSTCYPEFSWVRYHYSKPHQAPGVATSKAQMMLRDMLSRLLKDHRVELNYSAEGWFYEKQKSKSISLDIYCPSLSLAFEYQGEPHYLDTPIYGSPRSRQVADKTKSEVSLQGQNVDHVIESYEINIIVINVWPTKETLITIILTIHLG
jgi:hypothetical protein